MATGKTHEAARPEYATDVPYLRTFSNDLSPAVLRFVAALNGFTAPPDDDFDYLELGCGNGDTLLTLAAAYPDARFVGVDLNHAHTAFARDLAARGGLGNVRFFQGDFEALRAEDLPAFHYVACFGLLSWISPQKRAAAVALAGRALAPGGFFFASYNAMPGWAAVEPLRRLMLDAAAGGEDDLLARAHRGLSVARLLHDAGARYFHENPSAKEMLARMEAAGLAYTVHEYFLPDWHPMYFEDVARELAAAGLHFVGQLPLYLNYRDLCIPASLLPLFQPVTHRITFESLKDYALNEFFRRDAFVKGTYPRSDETTQRFLDEIPFGTLVAADAVQRAVSLPHYALRFAGPIFDVLIPALAGQPRSVTELAALPDFAGYSRSALRDAVLHLAIGQQVLPMRRFVSETSAQARAPLGGIPKILHPYNRIILEPPFTESAFFVLSSPVTGTGIVIEPSEARCLRAITGCDPGAGEAARPEEIARFVEERLPKLRQLGIIGSGA